MSVRDEVLVPAALDGLSYKCTDSTCEVCLGDINAALDAVLEVLTMPSVVTLVTDQLGGQIPRGDVSLTLEAIQVVLKT